MDGHNADLSLFEVRMPMDPIEKLLADVPLFALLHDEQRAFLAARVRIVKFDAGALLFQYGDPGQSMYVIKAGHVELSLKTKTGETMVLACLTAHHFFGEVSLMDSGPRTATARALDAVELLEVNRVDLDELFRLQPGAALHLLAATGGRQQMQRGTRLQAKQLVQIDAVDLQQFDGVQRACRCSARSAVHERDFAKKMMGSETGQHHGFAGLGLQREFDVTGFDHVHRLSRVAVLEQQRARIELHDAHPRG